MNRKNPKGTRICVEKELPRQLDRRPVRTGVLALTIAAVLLWGVVAVAQLPATIDLNVPPGSEASPVVRVYGDDTVDYLGSDGSDGIAFGDVNGDGYDDLIIGALRADPGGRSNAGEVYVIYGSASLPVSTVDLNTDGAISAAGETRILGDDGNDLSGSAVASGDVNGDGCDDVIIGVPRGAPGGRTEAGEIYIIYGSDSLPGTIVDLNTDGAISPAGETRILGDDFFDRAGTSVASGDVNGDGYDDVIIGAPFADPGSPARSDAGEVYVVYGGVGRPGTAVSLSSLPGTHGETRILGDDAGGRAGSVVDCGDVNGDGYDDIAFGAPRVDPAGRTNAGASCVVYGGAGLPASIVDLADGPGVNGETRVLGDDNDDYSGWSIATADVDGDGRDDVIIGAYRADPGGRGDAGEVYVIYGSGGLPGTSVDLSAAPGTNGETRILGDDVLDQAGWSVAGADVNGDGYDDVIVGARYSDTPGGSNAGELDVVYGSLALPNTTVDLSAGGDDVSVLGDNTDDILGYAVEAGADVNLNGVADFAASAYHGDNPSIDGTNNRAGYAVAVFGDGVAPGAMASEYFKAGAAPPRGIGGRLSPVVRTQVSFDEGTAAPVTVALTRSDAGISNLGDGTLTDVADVVWEVTTTRTGYAVAQVTFQYLDSEIVGLPEAGLTLFRASLLSGPWIEVVTQAADPDRNEITGTVAGLSFFALKTDTTPPVAGTVTSDAGDYTNDNSQLDFSWAGFDDPESGIVDYLVALGDGVDPEAYEGFTSVGLVATHTFTAGAPYADAMYVCTVRAVNGVGLTTDATADVTVDTTPPAGGAVTSDAGDYTNDNSQLDFSWAGFDDPESGIVDYEVALGDGVDPEAYAAFASVGLVGTTTFAGPFGDGLYVCTVRAVNGAGGSTDETASVTVDTTVPVAGTVTSDTGDLTNSTTELVFSWTGFNDPESGIADYEVALGDGVDPEAYEAFASVGLLETHTFNGTFTNGVTYVCTVRATNGAGSDVSASGDVTVDTDAPEILSIVLSDPSPTNKPTVDFAVTFTEAVAGVNLAAPFDDFAATVDAKAITGAEVTAVAGADDAYTVSVGIGSGNGTIRLDVLAAGGIVDLPGTPLAADYTAGPAYTIEHLAFVTDLPPNVDRYVGESYTFTVAMTGGTTPYTYAWMKDDAAIPGAPNAATYELTDLVTDDTGEYRCDVSDAYESVESSTLQLAVTYSTPAVSMVGLGVLILAAGAAGARALRRRR